MAGAPAVPIVPDWADPSIVSTAALLVLPAYALVSARRSRLDGRAMYWGAIVVLAGALWGGRVVLLAAQGGAGWSPANWLGVGDGGSSSIGALVGATLAGLAYARVRRLHFAAYADALVPAALLAYAVARVGCLLNGDDFGSVTHLPWAVRHAEGSVAYAAHLQRGWIAAGAEASLPVHPWPLYSALVALALFVALRRPLGAPGTRAVIALAAYGIARFMLEFQRGDEERVLGPLVVSQLLCAGMVVVAIIIRITMRRSGAARPVRVLLRPAEGV